MEQHPVPQNVTSFQFRLIGDMTIKQFGYLAGGAIGALICYNLPLPFFFTWPLTILCAFFGIGFAFIPIEERPMDVWVLSFLKNVYSPTMYVWNRSAPTIQPHTSAPLPLSVPLSPPKTTASEKQPAAHAPIPAAVTTVAQPPPPRPPAPQPAPQQAQTHTEKPHGSAFSWLDHLFVSQPTRPQQPTTPVVVPTNPPIRTAPPPPPPASRPIGVPVFSAPPPSIVGTKPEIPITPAQKQNPGGQQAQQTTIQNRQSNEQLLALQQQLDELKRELAKKSDVETKYLELQKQTIEALRQKQDMENRLVTLGKKAAEQQARPVAPATYKTPGVLSQRGPTVKVFTPEAAIKAGLPRLTTFPNVVTGILKDYDGGLLPGVLVTVKDPDGVPVRALKTNKLGQFAASTPLPNGVYIIEVEDPRGRFQFDRVQFTLNGSILPAIQVVAKSKKELDRAELERKIFSQPST